MIKQIVLYDEWRIPDDHKRCFREQNRDLWNAIAKIDNQYPKVDINIEHFIVYPEQGFYSIDFRFRCHNPQALRQLQYAYKTLYRQPLLNVRDTRL